MELARGPRVLVIGAGLGGMSAAISLAAHGVPVSVVEKNQRVGGRLDAVEQDGFCLDGGPSMITEPCYLRRLFEVAEKRLEDYLELMPVEPQWRVFFDDGTALDLTGDMRGMERELTRLGGEASGYWALMDYARAVHQLCREVYLEPGSDSLDEAMRYLRGSRRALGLDLLRSMDQVIQRRLQSEKLQQVLGLFATRAGASARQAPALLCQQIYAQLGHGLWHVRGGAVQLARALERLSRELGVELQLGREATELLRDGERVVGARLSDGALQTADVIVCNMDVLSAHQRLLGDFESAPVRRLRRALGDGPSALVVQLGVRGRALKLAHHNFFVARDPERCWQAVHREGVLPEEPTVYVGCPSKTDPSLAPEGHEALQIVVQVPQTQVPRVPAERYRSLVESVYRKLERMGLCGLESAITLEELLTPEDLAERTHAYRGSIYGGAPDRRTNYGLRAPKRSARYRNLYFVGSSVNPGAGVTMAVLCGQGVARRVMQDLLAS